jgi:hypothetical protein
VQEKAMEDYIVSLPSSIFIIYVILDHCNDQDDDDDEQMVDVGLREKADPKSKAKPAGRVLGRLCGLHPPSSSKLSPLSISHSFTSHHHPKPAIKHFRLSYIVHPHSFNYIVFPTRKKTQEQPSSPKQAKHIFLGLQ